MDGALASASRRYRAVGRAQLNRIPQLERLNGDQRVALEAVSAVLPFRVTDYVVSELIDWDDIPSDPIFQLTFPQPGMLEPMELRHMQDLVASGATREEIQFAARRVQARMNPHPAGQMQLNVPSLDGEPISGCQHKYRETVLFFPSQGQTCHAFCSYCFRWAQFVGVDELRFANSEVETLIAYLRQHPEVSDVLLTGGDPLVMKTKVLRRYVDALVDARLEHLVSIRIGSKALAYWPYRFTTDSDADELLRLFERVVSSGHQLALMAHFSHPRELGTVAVEEAIRRITATGAVIRCQAPLIRHVNDAADIWADLWRTEVRLGMVPYYMFVERDTGPKHYFEVPLARAYRIFSEAVSSVSGLGRTVRGPSMSATPGKVLIEGIAEVGGEKVFALKMIQARDQSWVNRLFFAKFDTQARWLDGLEPAFGGREFFFEPQLRAMAHGVWLPEWQRQAAEREEEFVVEGA
jgi:KamA family protein